MPKKKTTAQDKQNTKEQKLIENLARTIQQFIEGKGYHPLSQKDLFARLDIHPQHAELCKNILDGLIKTDALELLNGCYSAKKSSKPTPGAVLGVIHVHQRGFGFVQHSDPRIGKQDIFIPKHLTKNAVDGDTVEVLVNQDAPPGEKGPEGKVISIVTRGRTHIAGTILRRGRNQEMIAYIPLFGPAHLVIVRPTQERSLEVGDRLIMKIIEWGTPETETICEMSHYIGHISDPSCDIPAALEEFELRTDFSFDVLKEVEAYGTRVDVKEIKKRTDLRDLETFTIDPPTAKDFDDALSIELDKKGVFHLGVHIADVSHYVKADTALDKEARLRCNSTYFPGFCLPMLPSQLSDNLCSLKANVNRLTISVLMQFDSQGTLIDYKIVRSVIKSQKRLSYPEAKEIIDGKKSKHSHALSLMVSLCHLLKQKRKQRGSIEFALPEVSIEVDKKGVPLRTRLIEYDISHQLVEEFMLKANETIATHLSKEGKSLTFRIHEKPSDDDLKNFGQMARSFGFHLPEKPTLDDLQTLFEQSRNTPHAPYLAVAFIRSMRLACYSPDNIGHYGLSLEYYCHFTSPIRRYPDLVVHRILFEGDDCYEELRNIAQECSDQERVSAKAEATVVALKKLRLMETWRQQNPHRQYAAVITRVKHFGIFFELLDLMLEGFLHISDLGPDYYIFDEKRLQLYGERSGDIYQSGGHITVMMQEVNFITQENKWSLVDHEEAPMTSEESRPSRKKSRAPKRQQFQREKPSNSKFKKEQGRNRR